MKTFVMTLVGLAVLLTAAEVHAQQRWAFELRSGVDLSTQDVGNADLGTGFGFEGIFHYRFMPHLAAYAGWDWRVFTPDDAFAGPDADLDETGYAFGLRFEQPFDGEDPAVDGWAYWLRGGGTYNHIEIEDSDGDIIADSGHGLGWEVGGGLSYGFAEIWSVTPGVRYRSLSRDVEIGATTTEVDLQYVAFEVGLVRRF